MTTFKHGDKVTCEINVIKITDARISIDKDGMTFICQNEREGLDAEDKLGYKYSWKLNEDFTNPNVTNLKLAPKTIHDIEVGDVLVKRGEEFPVLMRSGDVVLFGHKAAYGYAASGNYTIAQLIEYGYTLKDVTPEPETITINGKTYNKAAVEERLAELEEVK